MKAYKLVEKGRKPGRAITYHVKPSKVNPEPYVYIVDVNEYGDEREYWLSTIIKETKRGWTITSWLLTVKPVKIFLPRENFDKVEIEE